MAGTVVITGANGSLGLGFVEALLSRYPEHTLIATVRNASPEKDPNTAELVRIISKYPNSKVNVEVLDLGQLASVRTFVQKLSGLVHSKKTPRISAIVCNAATLSLEAGQKFTSDGYEATFQVCHLSHYLLILMLLESMDPASGRIVMLGSITHYPDKPNPVSSLGPRFPENLGELVKPIPDPPLLVHDRGFQRYRTAKLANVTFALDLNERLKRDPRLSNVTVTAMDPGGLPASRSQAEQKKSTKRIMATINFFMPVLKHVTTAFRTTEDAGRELAAVSADPSFHGKRGYFVGQKEDAPAAVSNDVDMQERLWAACWRWSGMKPEETALQDYSRGLP
ncbi:short chain dehydrogenase/reductase SDR [Penicillium cataractarum]|uniref:3beta-hydroxysteroid 3-dehydrogenase n=1 Tax=Penicillium cataractarum TaxID=2100454 RepID=A0A9W9RNQ4_9EURO|nr:short chain dehydrogenase/reductase SDR [Penicillium cataractarum]KAJ5363590.1 short chain dehydrogenase/reductase SDR [Penicillium cataractarum]